MPARRARGDTKWPRATSQSCSRDQRRLTPLGIAMPDGSKPVEFQVLPVVLFGTKNQVKLRKSMKLDNTDSQYTIALGDVIRGEFVGGGWVRNMVRCSAPSTNSDMD